MNEKIISGLQQIGIGVKDVHTAWLPLIASHIHAAKIGAAL